MVIKTRQNGKYTRYTRLNVKNTGISMYEAGEIMSMLKIDMNDNTLCYIKYDTYLFGFDVKHYDIIYSR